MRILRLLRMAFVLFTRVLLASLPAATACRVIRFITIHLPRSWGEIALSYMNDYIDGYRLPSVEVRTKPGFLMRLELRDRWVQKSIYFLGKWEHDSTEIVSSTLKEGDVFFDLGANVGYFTLLAAQFVGRRGQVYAFEPVPEIFAKLEQNVKLNGFNHVTLVNAAVTDRSGKVAIEDVSCLTNLGTASLVPRQPGIPMLEVPAVSLDEFCRSHTITRIKLIKMDIEGAEMLALRGMSDLLSASRAPDLLCEVDDALLSRMGARAEDLCEFLSSLGFQIYRLTPRGLQVVNANSILSGQNYYFSKWPREKLPLEAV